MTKLKKNVNEAQVEKELHLQYLERQIEGEYAMHNRKFKQMEQELLKVINDYQMQLRTEEEVNNAIKEHLEVRTREINEQRKDRDALKDRKVANLDEQREQIMNDKQQAKEECDKIMNLIQEDNEERKQIEAEDKKQEDDERAKIEEKLAMEDAARYIQGRWDWF